MQVQRQQADLGRDVFFRKYGFAFFRAVCMQICSLDRLRYNTDQIYRKVTSGLQNTNKGFTLREANSTFLQFCPLVRDYMFASVSFLVHHPYGLSYRSPVLTFALGTASK